MKLALNVCKECRLIFGGRKRKFCSKECQRKNYRSNSESGKDKCKCGELKAKRSKTCMKCKRTRKPQPCKQCQKPFLPRDKQHNTFCSRECGFEYRRQQAAVRQKTREKLRLEQSKTFECRKCGETLSKDPKRNLRICEACKAPPKTYYRYEKVKRITKQCACGNTFEVTPGWYDKRTICNSCSRKEHQSNSKHRRRERMKTKKRTRVVRRSVWNRDGWECQHCGTTVATGEDYNKPSYPTIDHVIPLAKGGEHSMSNTMTLCRRCNTIKSDAIVASDVESKLIFKVDTPAPSVFAAGMS